MPSPWTRRHWLPLGLLAATVALLPLPLRGSYWITVLTLVAIYATVVVGYDLLVGYAGQVSLGHNGFVAFGAYATGILTVKAGWTPLPALAVGVALSAAVALGLGILALRVKGYYLAIATLAFGFIVHSLLLGFNRITGGATGIPDIPPLRAWGLVVATDLGHYYVAWAVCFLTLAFVLGVAESATGRALRAIHADEVAAALSGVPVARLKVQAFVLSAVVASVGGSLYAHLIRVVAPSDFTLFLTIQLLLMIFLGGVGTIWGGLLGVAFYKGMAEVVAQFEAYWLLIEGSIFVIVLLFFPRGILGIVRGVLDRWGRLPAPAPGVAYGAAKTERN